MECAMMYTSALRQHELVGRLSPSPAASVVCSSCVAWDGVSGRESRGVMAGNDVVLRCLTRYVRSERGRLLG